MKRPHNMQRIVAMHRMLFEMAGGNFSMRIPLSVYNDELESLVVLINMLAEELRESFLLSGYINPHQTGRLLATAALVLDRQCSIQDATPGFLEVSGYRAEEVIGRPLADFLFEGSERLAVLTGASAEQGGIAARTVQLQFALQNGLSIAADCTVEPLGKGDAMLVSFVVPYLREATTAESGEMEMRKPNTRRSDARLIQKVYDYILGHLDEPLPSLRELSRLFGTNEFKLKEGFRHFFQTSIYQFYNEERLKRAHVMIRQTDMPLKGIALLNGFNSYPNFSKSFKKHFGFPPNRLPRI